MLKCAAIFVALTAITSSTLCQDGQSLEQMPTFRSTVELVLVDALVIGKKTGRPVDSLQREDFEIFENGLKQDVSFLTRDDLPLSVVFLFDLTDTVRPILKPLAEGDLEALQHLKSSDEVSIMVYAASAELLQDFTRDRTMAVAAIEKARDMKSREAAFFNEGVFQAALQAGRATNPRSRRVIIWLTDNVPNIPSEAVRRRLGKSLPQGALHTEKDAFKELFQNDTAVTALLERSALSDVAIVAYSKNPMLAVFRQQLPPGDVHKYANRTGGLVMNSSKEDVSKKLAELIDRLRSRYVLGYRPSIKQPTGKFCEIAVKVSPEVEAREGKIIVRTKKGYYRR